MAAVFLLFCKAGGGTLQDMYGLTQRQLVHFLAEAAADKHDTISYEAALHGKEYKTPEKMTPLPEARRGEVTAALEAEYDNMTNKAK